MFRFLYRYIRKTNFITLCIISMLLFFSLMVGNIENITKSILEVNNQLTNNYIDVSFKYELKNEKVIELINNIEKCEDIIIRYYLQSGFDYDVSSEGIYFNGEFNNSYNLLEGRFFNKEDFNRNHRLAVIGKDVLKYVKIENNKGYILRGLDKYEVIGVIGKEELSTRYDNKVLYNLDSILNNKETLAQETWWIDSVGKTKNEIEEVIRTIGNNELIEIVNRVDNIPNPLVQAMKGSKTLIVSFILIIICIMLTLIRSILYWIESISLEIGIRKNYGATNKEIFKDIVKRYILISIVSFFTSIILQKILLKFKFLGLENYKISYINIIFSIAFIITLGVIFIWVAMYKINKIEIQELLKEKII